MRKWACLVFGFDISLYKNWLHSEIKMIDSFHLLYYMAGSLNRIGEEEQEMKALGVLSLMRYWSNGMIMVCYDQLILLSRSSGSSYLSYSLMSAMRPTSQRRKGKALRSSFSSISPLFFEVSSIKDRNCQCWLRRTSFLPYMYRRREDWKKNGLMEGRRIEWQLILTLSQFDQHIFLFFEMKV